MSAPRSAKAALAAARVLAGERKATVSRDTGVSRSTIDRHLCYYSTRMVEVRLLDGFRHVGDVCVDEVDVNLISAA